MKPWFEREGVLTPHPQPTIQCNLQVIQRVKEDKENLWSSKSSKSAHASIGEKAKSHGILKSDFYKHKNFHFQPPISHKPQLGESDNKKGRKPFQTKNGKQNQRMPPS